MTPTIEERKNPSEHMLEGLTYGHWTEAELLEDQGEWAWRLWRASVELPPGRHELRVRAWDSAGATQPETPAAVWNPKGYANSAWGRIDVTLA